MHKGISGPGAKPEAKDVHAMISAIDTAAKRGITPAEALSRMMRGKEPLLTIPPAAVFGGLAAQDNYKQ